MTQQHELTPWTPFFRAITPWVTGVVAVAAAATLIWAIFIAESSSLPTATTEQFVVFVLAAALGIGVFMWAASSGSILVLAGAGISASVALGLWINNEFGGLVGVTWAVCTTAPIAFVGVLLAQAGERTITKNSMRNALTASFVLTYLVSVGLVVFFRGDDPNTPLPPITETLISNFTFLLGVVVAFYFGSATFEKVAQVRSLTTSLSAADEIDAAVED